MARQTALVAWMRAQGQSSTMAEALLGSMVHTNRLDIGNLSVRFHTAAPLRSGRRSGRLGAASP